ncbi:uncharacterized protein LOC130591811 [Beta vulgaris subsp. vulgaris]|uniref:uncharacterized protein LOC130591811 n=1 Tax=Beta vulgaris subsp. vulgaris TaxID=3555 RepID=UPI002549563F|nr:uncharacterized protein LOC130591811 [Beta vulgaris subsp. vulgaris]
MGDFNCVRYPNETIGAVVRAQETMPMNNWCASCGLDDLKSSGCFFTWNNKQQGYNIVFSKIDRALSNMAWQEVFPTAKVSFMPEGDFDHSPALLTVYPRGDSGKKPFKYYTMWRLSPQYDSTIRDQWNKRVEGTKMFVVVQKLKLVKAALKNLNKVGFHDVQVDDSISYHAMIDAQVEMHKHPGQIAYLEAEQIATRQYQVKHQIYIEYLKQKAKLEWIKHGDENTAIFHQSIRARRVQMQLYAITDAHGVWKDNAKGVEEAFIDYYQKLLGNNHVNRRHVLQQIVQIGPLINEEHRRVMNAPYTTEEVKAAMFSIPGNKAPGSDGFGAHIYRDNWELVGNEVTAAILDFFTHKKLLKELNSTVITLILELRGVLPDIIAENQGGFVHGRYIVHNIMVVKDMVKHYGRKSAKPSCLIKLDLQKAYDTVDWMFLHEMSST